MVQRNANFHAVLGTAQRTVCAENPPGERPGRVLQAVEQSVVCVAAKAERRGDPGARGRVPSVHEVFGDAATCRTQMAQITMGNE